MITDTVEYSTKYDMLEQRDTLDVISYSGKYLKANLISVMRQIQKVGNLSQDPRDSS